MSPLATPLSEHPQDDYQFKYALKNMLPIPSISKQQILLDEYYAQISQFSISINRIIKEDISDENCVHLLKLMGGMYTLLKTTLLSPPFYYALFVRISWIEDDLRRYFHSWSVTANEEDQIELFELAWWCESTLPRVYLVTMLFSALPVLWKEPRWICETFSLCKSLQHPLKGSFLYSRLHTFILRLFNNEDISEEMRTICSGYSVEVFTSLLRLFCRWHQSLPAKTTEISFIASLFEETFEGVCGQISQMTSYDIFEELIFPTFLVEIVNCGDSLAQSLTFQSITKVRRERVCTYLYELFAHLFQ